MRHVSFGMIQKAGEALRRLKKRIQFLKAARGLKMVRRGFVLQTAPCDHDNPGVGFTVTKRVGNAVQRNRIKRRLRAATQLLSANFRPGYDYVLIGRKDALHESFDRLTASLAKAITKTHASALPGERCAETRKTNER